jgi:hypothetical protein
MVGRFVQQHQFRRLGQKLGQRRPATFAAGGGGDRGGGVELQPLGHHGKPVILAFGQVRGGEIAKRGKAGKVGLLLHIADGHAGRHGPQAAVGLDQPGHHLHQRRLARAVAADQRDAVAGLDGQRELVEDRVAAEGQRDAGKLEKGCACHGREVEGDLTGVNVSARGRGRMAQIWRHRWHPWTASLILDLTHVLAGPFCTQSLQDLGARVIKVERPGTGDDTRAFPPFLAGESAYFATLNAGKQSIALDLKAEADRAILTGWWRGRMCWWKTTAPA